MINEKLQYYSTDSKFQALKNAGNIADDAIAFIDETQQIFTHGSKYSIGTLSAENAGLSPILDVPISIADAVLTVDQELSTTQQSQALANLLNRVKDAGAKLKENVVILQYKYDSILTQEDINKPDTTYVILYDFDLNNKTINLPNNCTIIILGGSLNNGILNINNAEILPTYNSITGEELIVSGYPAPGTVKWNSNKGIPMWSTGLKWVDATGK